MGSNSSKSEPPQPEQTYRTALMILDDCLPQPDEDRRVAMKTRKLQTFIDSHATLYHDHPIRKSKEEIAILLKDLFQTDPLSVHKLASNLQRPNTRAVFIRILLARVVCQAIDIHETTPLTLLPLEFSSFMTAFAANPRSKETIAVDQLAICEWRRISSFLLLGPQNRHRELRDSHIRIGTLLESLDQVLVLFARESSEEGNRRRLTNLRAVLSAGTDLGVLLFGQPCSWKLDWNIRPTEDGGNNPEKNRGFVGRSASKRDISKMNGASTTRPPSVYQRKAPAERNLRSMKRTKSVSKDSYSPSTQYGTDYVDTESEDQSQTWKRNVSQHRRRTSVAASTHEGDGDGSDYNTIDGRPRASSRPPVSYKSASLSRANSRQRRHSEDLTGHTQDAQDLGFRAQGAPTSTTIYFPALVKTTDEYGRKFERPVIVSEPVIHRAASVVR